MKNLIYILTVSLITFFFNMPQSFNQALSYTNNNLMLGENYCPLDSLTEDADTSTEIHDDFEFYSDGDLDNEYSPEMLGNDTIYEHFLIEETAEFIGGNDAFITYIQQHIIYPQTTINSCMEGKVYISFCVLKNGSIAKVKAIWGSHPYFINESIKVIQSMPKWKPGVHKGRKVVSSYAVPIRFTLDADNDSIETIKSTKQERDSVFEAKNNSEGIIEPIKHKKNIDLKIFPNPAMSIVNIEVSKIASDMFMQIANMNGQIIKISPIYSCQEKINVNDMKKGMYFIHIVSEELNVNKIGKMIVK